MPADPKRVQLVFRAAVEELDAAARAVILERECGNDGDLRRRVEALLNANDEPDSYLDQPAVAPVIGTVDYAPIAEKPGTMVGPYKLKEQIGEGGFGLVFVAEQIEPVKRKVALKVIKPGMDTREVIGRFEAERQALALMDHPHIARVLDAGATDSGRPYFVMELVRGIPITKYCDKNQLTPKERLELFVTVCQAIQHAHQKGIIHRDVKPSNVLVTSHDGKPVAKVIDFGVAKAISQQLTDRSVYTNFAQMIGTPLYMSPEQAEMSGLDIDTRSDIFSLGVLLYELLTGTTPLDRKKFAKAAYDEVRRLIREEEPPKPSTRLSTSDSIASIAAQRHMEPAKLSKLMRGDLDWITMKCLEKDRTRRYETANGLARDIQRYLSDEPVEACPPSATYRLRKFARKHSAALATAGTIILLLAVGIAVSSWQAIRALRAERDASWQRDVAVENEQKALASEALAQQSRLEAIAAQEALRETLYAAEMNLVQAAWEADNVPRVHELLEGQIPPAGKRDLRGFEWHYWDRQSHAELRNLQLPGLLPSTPLGVPMFNHDGTSLAKLIPQNGSFELQVWDTSSGQKVFAASLPGKPQRSYQSAFSADGSRLAVIGRGNPQGKEPGSWQVRIWNVHTGQELPVLPIPQSSDNFLLALDAAGTRLLTLGSSVSLAGTPLVTTRTKLDVWEIATGKPLLSVSPGSARPGLAMTADGKRVAAIVALDGKVDMKSPHVVKVWDVETGKELLSLTASKGEPFGHLAFTSDGKKIAASGLLLEMDGIWIWDSTTGKELTTIASKQSSSAVRFSPNGKFVVGYGRSDPTVSVWDAETGQMRDVLKGHATGVGAAVFSSDGKRLYTAAWDGMIRTWNVSTEDRSTAKGFFGFHWLRSCISPDGSRLGDAAVFGPELDVIKIRDTSGKVLHSLPLPVKGLADSLIELTLSHAGTRVAATWYMRSATDTHCDGKVWETATGQELFAFSTQGRVVRCALSPDGTRLAVPTGVKDDKFRFGVRSDVVKIWDVNQKKELLRIEPRVRGDSYMCAFSPDGARLAITPRSFSESISPAPDAQGEVQILDTTTGKEILTLKSSTRMFHSLVFSADGSLLAAGSRPEADETGPVVVEVWETATGQRRHKLKGHASRVEGIAFSPDGRRIVTGGPGSSVDGSGIKIWDTATGKELTTFKYRGTISALAFSSDGGRLVAARSLSPSDPVHQIWDGALREGK